MVLEDGNTYICHRVVGTRCSLDTVEHRKSVLGIACAYILHKHRRLLNVVIHYYSILSLSKFHAFH